MWMYEESLHLPLLVRYPHHIKPMTVTSDIVSILDFASTFLDYAEAEIPKEFQGCSIRPILEGKTPEDWRKSLYYHYYGQYDVPAHYGVRTTNHKLIYYYNENSWELFDILQDPKEMHNLYNRSEQSEDVENMKSTLQAQRKRFENVDQ
jgi:arylsulfatase A-like enzyme